jgi:hypothetical protein
LVELGDPCCTFSDHFGVLLCSDFEHLSVCVLEFFVFALELFALAALGLELLLEYRDSFLESIGLALQLFYLFGEFHEFGRGTCASVFAFLSLCLCFSRFKYGDSLVCSARFIGEALLQFQAIILDLL